ncbi:type I restriction enzyme S subunit [Pseudoxanthomonas japonensis]|uniref:restriction endonuclease subunit S n=1 Tax=Pseudoxanthomonas japonensis TaxID=69284 RepID=UPI00285D21BB|nr:hypothetical protein [Pseudoxanthomonas japonensis]MDR7069150.1 type I restriction enzyme S subunit [Pseudoxanthomonas japonensis]
MTTSSASARAVDVNQSCWPIDTAYFIQPPTGIETRYLYYCLSSQQLGQLDKSTAIPSLSRDDLYSVEVAVAPFSEQARIVEKLEDLLSDLDAGVAALNTAQVKLAQYRQSLLKAAVEGTLTADWRAAQGKSKETGAKLLQRILKERRARWEQKQLTKFEEQDKAPPKGWQAKYPEPAAPDLSGLPSLQDGWVWTSVDALIEEGPQNGLYLPAHSYGEGVLILRIDDFQIGWHRVRDELNRVQAEASITDGFALRLGDIVINRVNSKTHLGKCLEVPASLDSSLFESNIMRMRLHESVSATYVTLYLGSEAGRALLTRDAKWAVNQASINQQDVRRTPVPLPSHEEQIVIAECLELHHAAIGAQLSAIDASIKQATAQRKNLLKAAFSGQLVPQDPNDEPASALLARIRAERESGTATTAKKRGRKAKEKT